MNAPRRAFFPKYTQMYSTVLTHAGCVCETQMPPSRQYQKNVTLTYDLDI